MARRGQNALGRLRSVRIRAVIQVERARENRSARIGHRYARGQSHQPFAAAGVGGIIRSRCDGFDVRPRDGFLDQVAVGVVVCVTGGCVGRFDTAGIVYCIHLFGRARPFVSDPGKSRAPKRPLFIEQYLGSRIIRAGIARAGRLHDHPAGISRGDAERLAAVAIGLSVLCGDLFPIRIGLGHYRMSAKFGISRCVGMGCACRRGIGGCVHLWVLVGVIKRV
ncbi:MAG: hypothetical protein PGMFKBFP_00601 [Anaerolineales bacterium]|nr:hypothetical protein [Anaerolineales bacterium]